MALVLCYIPVFIDTFVQCARGDIHVKGIECLDGHEGSEFTNGSSRWKGVQVRLWFLGTEYSISHCLMVMCLVCVVIFMDWVEGPLVRYIV